MTCPDCNDTGKITLFTTIEDCKTCDIATITRYILSNVTHADDTPQYDEFSPMLHAVNDKTSREFRLMVNSDLYTIDLQTSNQVVLMPRHCAHNHWAYQLAAPNIHIEQKSETTIIDDEEYITLRFIHIDNLFESVDEVS